MMYEVSLHGHKLWRGFAKSSQIYISLLHLDFFFLLGFWLQYLTEVSLYTLYLGAPILCVAPFHLFFAGQLVRKEKRWGSYVTIFLFIGEIAVTALAVGFLFSAPVPGSPVIRTTAYASLAIPSLTASLVMTIVCTKNFGKGLKPHLRQNQVTTDNRSSMNSHRKSSDFGREFKYQELSEPAPVRMDIN